MQERRAFRSELDEALTTIRFSLLNAIWVIVIAILAALYTLISFNPESIQAPGLFYTAIFAVPSCLLGIGSAWILKARNKSLFRIFVWAGLYGGFCLLIFAHLLWTIGGKTGVVGDVSVAFESFIYGYIDIPLMFALGVIGFSDVYNRSYSRLIVRKRASIVRWLAAIERDYEEHESRNNDKEHPRRRTDLW